MSGSLETTRNEGLFSKNILATSDVRVIKLVLEFGSAVLTENGLMWVVSPAGSALISVGCRSWNGKGLAFSGIQVELVSSTTSEP